MAIVDIIVPSEKGMELIPQTRLHDMVRASQCFCGGHAPWACPKGKHSILMLPTGLGRSIVHRSRNKMVALALYASNQGDGRPPADYLLLADDDMVVEKNYLNRMLTYKPEKRIITGISTTRRDPVRPNIRGFNEETKKFTEIPKWDFNSNKLFEVGAVGAAFMLVPRILFEEMAEAYLKCWFERLEDKRKYGDLEPIDAYWDKKEKLRRERHRRALEDGGDWADAACNWFEYFANTEDTQVTEHGEDITFCWKARQMGFRIYADPQITPGHLGKHAFSVADYRYEYESAVESGLIKEAKLAE